MVSIEAINHVTDIKTQFVSPSKQYSPRSDIRLKGTHARAGGVGVGSQTTVNQVGSWFTWNRSPFIVKTTELLVG